ncbi:putative sulfate exporter family transporter [Chitinophaga pollutisoli]|uniref:Sulfate exporter family transporter n=1 Tax=Chitinophaga pollutisoli TaxID=3133966 RepID=A0ABZ2YNV0_9BACT
MQKKLVLHEDWISVILAFTAIILILLGVRPSMPKFDWSSGGDLLSRLTDLANYGKLAAMFCWIIGALLIAYLLGGKKLPAGLFSGALAIFAISMFAQVITSNAAIKDLGIEIVLFSLLLGLFISNVIGLPDWIKPALQTELFIKTGLVLLGSGIIFQELMKGGGLGVIQSVVVVFSVWYFTFWLCKKFGLDDEFRMMISSAVSICGVSAAIATSGAIEGDNKKLSHVISLVLIVAIPMMIFMPYIAQWMDMPPEVAGAWLGGTIDTSGAVVAAGTLLGEEALKYATLVKFSQNVLLGLAAFFISLWWAYAKKTENQPKPGLRTIWERFPKFVLGFILVSLVFSFLLSPETVKSIKSPIKELQTCFFALAFTCIGLETKFTDIFRMENGRPAMAFIIAQVFNVLLTLGVAYLVFGGILFK